MRYVHALSPRRGGPFRDVTLSGVSEAFSLSTLFGHVRGAYTGADHGRDGAFALAGGGTLAIDELGKAHPAVQCHLLEVLDRGTFSPLGSERVVHADCRVVFATNTDLQQLVAEGRFLEDLLSRVEGFPIAVPSLEERREDIPAWARWFAEDAWCRWGNASPVPRFADDLMSALVRAPWPRNLRQLRLCVERLLTEAAGDPVLTLALCRRDLEYLRPGGRELAKYSLAELESLLARHGGRVDRSAKALGVHRVSLSRRLGALRKVESA